MASASASKTIKHGNKLDVSKKVTIHVEVKSDHVEIRVQDEATGNVQRLHFRT